MAETSKKRTVRIPLDYYKRPDRLAPWRLACRLLAVLACGRVGLRSRLGLLELPRGGRSGRDGLPRTGRWPGPMPPGTRNARRATSRSARSATRPGPPRSVGGSSQSDAQCKRCHAGPVHHASQEPGRRPLACASCHHDHRGRDASLVRIGDQHCTQCHSDLTAGHVKPGYTPEAAVKVTRFDANLEHHPEFRATKEKDPGRLVQRREAHDQGDRDPGRRVGLDPRTIRRARQQEALPELMPRRGLQGDHPGLCRMPPT